MPLLHEKLKNTGLVQRFSIACCCGLKKLRLKGTKSSKLPSLIKNLQLSDSGVYSVTFKVPQQTRHITLIVSEPHFNHGNADTGKENMKARSTSKAVCAIFAVSVLCGFITIGTLFLVLFLHFTHMTCALLPSSQESFESC
ncbi:hypothetical protein KIL84_022731 [Mauremys mutica]|uniref:Uncharacterized protein n=1 Tax=Mauremys mutica TaxID=74926 RepID=A0A9D3WNR5_9SAUR|nr:hypothetical protein KIL84_022731 [Mauremys mutica]